MEAEQSFDFTSRNNELRKIVFITEFLHYKFYDVLLKESTHFFQIDIDQSNAVAGLLVPLYNHMRKMKNTIVANRGQTYGANIATIGTRSHTISSLRKELMRTAGFEDFDYMIATPLIDLLTAFKMSYDEVQLSCSKFKVRSGNQIVEKKINSYGLSNVHIPLLTGLTYKPERRGRLMKTLGPLTLAIMLANENRYHDKMANALKESIKMLPMCDQVIDCLRDLRSANDGGTIFKAMDDVLSVIGSRSSSKILFPLYVVVKKLMHTPDSINLLNFSGNEGIIFYNLCIDEFWRKKYGGTTSEISQVVFHSMFVKSIEDLGNLFQITNQNVWNTRTQLNAVFENSSGQQSKAFTPIKYIYFSRLASANMMRYIGTFQPMLFNIQRFVGNRKRNYSEAFKTYLGTGTKATAYGRDIMSLTYALNQLKDSYAQSLRKGEFDKAGTVGWMKLEGGTLVNSEFEPQESGLYFYS